jgi:hypothetical protein
MPSPRRLSAGIIAGTAFSHSQGQKRRLTDGAAASGLPLQADHARAGWDFASGPTSDIRYCTCGASLMPIVVLWCLGSLTRHGGASWSSSSASQLKQSECNLPFLLRFHSCDLIRDCFVELSHRRLQIPSPASSCRVDYIILAPSGDIVGIRMRGAICLIRLRRSWHSFLDRSGSDRRYGGAGRRIGASFVNLSA